MRKFANGVLTVIGFSIGVALLSSPIWGLIALCMWLESASCHSKGSAMHMAATWGPMQDCVIEYLPGKFIPLANYRATETHR